MGHVTIIINPEDFNELNINDYILIKNIKNQLESGKDKFKAIIINKNKIIDLYLPNLSKDDRRIILAGSLINDSKTKLS